VNARGIELFFWRTESCQQTLLISLSVRLSLFEVERLVGRGVNGTVLPEGTLDMVRMLTPGLCVEVG
jgi:hypothetical protein